MQTTTQTITEDLEKNVVEIVTVEETDFLDGTEQQKSSSSDTIQQQTITVEQKSTISNISDVYNKEISGENATELSAIVAKNERWGCWK